MYELRTYLLRLDKMAEFLRETERLFHLRTRQSPVLGYWTGELGGLHQVVHIWPYGELTTYPGYGVLKYLRTKNDDC